MIPKIPKLKGIASSEEIKKAKIYKKPLFLGIPLAGTNKCKVCQLDCIYCFVEEDNTNTKLLNLNDHFKIIDQFEKIGGKYVKTATVGEPFLDRNFYDPFKNNPLKSKYPLIDYANKKGIYWTSFSNLVCINSNIAGELYEKDVSLIGKLNSLNPDIHGKLCGDTKFFERKY